MHAWSTIFTYRLEAAARGQGVVDWLERSFHGLLLNFTWWVHRKDRADKNVFEGGFLGLDNIGVFDRSAPLPTGGYLEQADGTAWMALFCQNMLEIAVELTMHRATYLRMCLKFVEHFLWISSSMFADGEGVGMWDEQDGFFYDVLQLPNRSAQRLKVRSMVGLLPLCAVTVFHGQLREQYPEVAGPIRDFMDAHPELTRKIHDPTRPGCEGRLMAAVLDETRLRRVLERMLDENEFLSPYGNPLAVAAACAGAVRIPGRRSGIPGVVSACRIGQRHVRRQFELARPGVDARERTHNPGAPAVLQLLRRGLHHRLSNRFRSAHDSL